MACVLSTVLFLAITISKVSQVTQENKTLASAETATVVGKDIRQGFFSGEMEYVIQFAVKQGDDRKTVTKTVDRAIFDEAEEGDLYNLRMLSKIE
jgi:hypothetical protein